MSVIKGITKFKSAGHFGYFFYTVPSTFTVSVHRKIFGSRCGTTAMNLHLFCQRDTRNPLEPQGNTPKGALCEPGVAGTEQ